MPWPLADQQLPCLVVSVDLADRVHVGLVAGRTVGNNAIRFYRLQALHVLPERLRRLWLKFQATTVIWSSGKRFATQMALVPVGSERIWKAQAWAKKSSEPLRQGSPGTAWPRRDLRQSATHRILRRNPAAHRSLGTRKLSRARIAWIKPTLYQ